MPISERPDIPVFEKKKLRKKFLYYFRQGFQSHKYMEWERGYKWAAHLRWESDLNRKLFSELLENRKYNEIASRAIRIESRTNLLFSFEKMALKDAVIHPTGSKAFAEGLYNYIYGEESLKSRFENFSSIVSSLPRKQTRVFTWPVVTVFGFIANPAEHIFLKPKVTKSAAAKYGYPFHYLSRPNWDTYKDLLRFATQLKVDLADLKPCDLIDIQSFIWVLASDEYPD